MDNTVGKTICIDDTTLDAAGGKYARVCVQVDIATLLIPFITVLACHQHVEYEGLRLICFECGRYGHRSEVCPTMSKQTAPVPAQPTQSVGRPPHIDESEGKFGS